MNQRASTGGEAGAATTRWQLREVDVAVRSPGPGADVVTGAECGALYRAYGRMRCTRFDAVHMV